MTNEEAISVLRNNTDLGYGIVIENEEITNVKQALDMAIKALGAEQKDGDLISRFRDYQIEWLTSHNDIDLRETETWVVQFLKDTAECFLKTELPSAEKTYGDLTEEIDKLPRIKVGNSNSPTVKYCIDERLLYEILEKMKGEAEREKAEQTENPTKDIISALEYWKSVDDDNKMVKWLTELQEYRKAEREKSEKTAEWIFIDNKKIIAKCSNCTLLHDLMYGTRYCPNCGRRMKGVE